RTSQQSHHLWRASWCGGAKMRVDDGGTPVGGQNSRQEFWRDPCRNRKYDPVPWRQCHGGVRKRESNRGGIAFLDCPQAFAEANGRAMLAQVRDSGFDKSGCEIGRGDARQTGASAAREAF